MNGPLAQLVALTCHANAHIRGLRTARFFPENSTSRFCDSIKFTSVSRRLWGGRSEKPVAATPDEWFLHLDETRALGVRIFRIAENHELAPDRTLAGLVGGGGNWVMEVVAPNQTFKHWVADWQVWNQDAPERRIWRVVYRCVDGSRTSPVALTLLDDASARLLISLIQVREFANIHDLSDFAQCFESGIHSLTDSERSAYHQDLAPADSLPVEATALLDACQHAWVFGGMGSWNDLGFDGNLQTEYDSVSEQLFDALTQAIAAAANASFVLPFR